MAKCDCWASPKPDYCSGEAEWLIFWPGCAYCGGSDCYDFPSWEALCTGCAQKYIQFAAKEPRSITPERQYQIKPYEEDAEAIWYQGDELPEWAKEVT